MIAVIAVTGVDATNKAEREHLSNDVMKNRLGSAKATSAKAKRSKSLPMVVREPDEAEKRAIAAAKQVISEMEPRFDVGTKIKTENGKTQIQQGPKHSDLDGWRTQFVAAFGTTSATVVGVELERIAKALRQRDGTIDPAELDTVIAIVSGQRAKNELEAMVICQMAVRAHHAFTRQPEPEQRNPTAGFKCSRGRPPDESLCLAGRRTGQASSWRRAPGCCRACPCPRWRAGDVRCRHSYRGTPGPHRKPRTTPCNEQPRAPYRFRWPRDVGPKAGAGDRASLRW